MAGVELVVLSAATGVSLRIFSITITDGEVNNSFFNLGLFKKGLRLRRDIKLRLSIRMRANVLSFRMLNGQGFHLAREFHVNPHRGISKKPHLGTSPFPAHLLNSILNCWHMSSVICCYLDYRPIILSFRSGLDSNKFLSQSLFGF